MEQENPRERSRLKEIPDHIRAFIKTRLAYYKLVAIEGAASAASGAITGLLLFIFGLFFILFLFIGLALLIGSAIGSAGGGFLIVAALFLVLSGIVVFFNKPLIKDPVTKMIITKMAGDTTNGQSTTENNRPEEPAGREREAADTGG
jgi:membrane protein implicated in regulation of membrane protease activity